MWVNSSWTSISSWTVIQTSGHSSSNHLATLCGLDSSFIKALVWKLNTCAKFHIYWNTSEVELCFSVLNPFRSLSVVIFLSASNPLSSNVSFMDQSFRLMERISSCLFHHCLKHNLKYLEFNSTWINNADTDWLGVIAVTYIFYYKFSLNRL